MDLLILPQIGFTYDCRQCEKPILATADLFPMCAQRFVCRCSCGESALVARIETGQLIVEFPCSICGQRHRTRLDLREVLSGDPAALRCPVTDTASCFVGTPERLSFMDSSRSDEEVAELVCRLIGIEPPQRTRETAEHPSAADALCAARDLAARDAIYCKCGSLRFTAAYDDGVLRISCAVCGAVREFPMRSGAELAAFLQTKKLML